MTLVEGRVWLLRDTYTRDITNQDAGKLDGSPDYVSPALKIGTTNIKAENRESVNPLQILCHRRQLVNSASGRTSSATTMQVHPEPLKADDLQDPLTMPDTRGRGIPYGTQRGKTLT